MLLQVLEIKIKEDRRLVEIMTTIHQGYKIERFENSREEKKIFGRKVKGERTRRHKWYTRQRDFDHECTWRSRTCVPIRVYWSKDARFSSKEVFSSLKSKKLKDT